MLNIRLICVGKLKERFYAEAVAEYAKRLGAFCRLELIELPEERLSEKPSAAEIEAALNREAEQIEKKLLKDGTLVCLCVEGGQMDSEAFAGLLTRTENSGRPRLSFVIGGSFGLAQKLKDRSGPSPEHVENDLSAPSCPGDAAGADLPRVSDQGRVQVP